MRRVPLGLLSCVAVIVFWQVLSGRAFVNPALLPPPSRVAPAVWNIVASGSIIEPLTQTLGLLAVGYGVGCVLAIGLGLLMGFNRHVYNVFEPLVELLRTIPKPALVPPLFLFLGIGAATKITIVALAAFFPVLINTVQGVRGVDPVLLNTARTFRRSTLSTIAEVVLPAALPMILTGMRVSLGLALTLVVLAEMLIGSTGVGFLILDLQRSFAITDMLAWVFILGVIGVSLNAAFETIEHAAVPWRSK